ncbi:MAG: S24/S26 family peptidase [Bacteroidales bacterium]|nr:S24/S26 family peptidase [Bacteroidales bacterium]
MSKTLIINKAVMMEEIRQLVAEGISTTITVKGNSMNPFIVDGRDRITLGPFKDNELRRGCVALVRDIRGEYLVHRVIARDGDMVTLLGDGNVRGTEKAHVSDVIALMRSVERKGRTVSVDGFIWKSYSWLWMLLEPVRRWPLALWRKLFLPRKPQA